jgi:hypothetical protein
VSPQMLRFLGEMAYPVSPGAQASEEPDWGAGGGGRGVLAAPPGQALDLGCGTGGTRPTLRAQMEAYRHRWSSPDPVDGLPVGIVGPGITSS